MPYYIYLIYRQFNYIIFKHISSRIKIIQITSKIVQLQNSFCLLYYFRAIQYTLYCQFTKKKIYTLYCSILPVYIQGPRWRRHEASRLLRRGSRNQHRWPHDGHVNCTRRDRTSSFLGQRHCSVLSSTFSQNISTARVSK